tara:strand:- start:13 stop:825 length:813 start_codon:yes stop_codon:yes gene_type:complete
MKTPYLYFGRKGYIATAGVVNGGYSALTNANSGMLPIAKNNSTLPQSLRILFKSTTVVGSVRGNLLLTATDATQVDFVDGSALTAATAAGEVTNMSGLVKSFTVDGSEAVTVLDVSDTSGMTIITGDTVYMEEMNFDATVLPINTVGADLCVPATSYLGAEPLAFTEGVGVNAGLYHDGTALDATRLYFKSGDGSPAVDTVDLVHTAGKYKDICEIMEEVINSNVYDSVIKMHYLTAAGSALGDGQVVHKKFTDRGILIKRCLITPVARS